MNLKLLSILLLFSVFYIQSFAQDDHDQLYKEAVALKEASKFEEAIEIFDLLDSLCQTERGHHNLF